MKELNEEIKLTLNLMQADISDGAHEELQFHLYNLLDMKRDEISKRMTERSWVDDQSLYESGLIIGRAKPLTIEEIQRGGWWCADVSEDCANAFKSKGLQVYNSSDWGTDGLWDCCIVDTSDGVITRSFSSNYTSKHQIHRIGNDFY